MELLSYHGKKIAERNITYQPMQRCFCTCRVCVQGNVKLLNDTHIVYVLLLACIFHSIIKENAGFFFKCTSEDDWSKCERISKKESRAAGITETLHDKKNQSHRRLKIRTSNHSYYSSDPSVIGYVMAWIGLIVCLVDPKTNIIPNLLP